MDPSIKSKEFSLHGLLHFFHGGMTRQQTLELLLKCHEGNPKMFPHVDYRLVDFWYTSFEKKNFNLNQIPKIDPLSKLENLAVLDQVMHQVSASDQMSLLEASPKIKQLVQHENRLFELIEFRMSTNSLLLKTICGITRKVDEVIFQRKDNGCGIIRDKITTASESCMFDAAFEELKKCVEKIHTKVETLIIKHNERVEEVDKVRFFTGVVAAMSLPKPLHVEEFQVGPSTEEELDVLLGLLKLESLNELDVVMTHTDADDRLYRLSAVTNFSKCCPNLINCKIFPLYSDVPIATLAHIPWLLIRFNSITVEEMVDYKHKLLHSPNFRSHYIMINHNEEQKKTLLKALAPFDSEFGEFEEKEGGFWKLNDDQSKVIKFELEFQSIDIKKVDPPRKF